MTSNTLTIEQLDGTPARWSFEDAERIRIGRAAENDVCVSHPEVSRTHCEIQRDGEGWKCRNLGRNGIFVEGNCLDEVVLTEGLVLRLSHGGPKLRFRFNLVESDSGIDLAADPITDWITECRKGGETAATKLWNRYFEHILLIAHRRLRETAKRVVDEEDLAADVMDSFFRGLRENRFELAGREELWKLLVVITTRQAVELIRNSNRQKRGGGRVRGDSILLSLGDSEGAGFDIFPGHEPTPELIAAASEQTDHLIETLDSQELRAIALWKLEDWSNAEIAEKLACSVRTVERRLAEIRTIWLAHGDSGVVRAAASGRGNRGSACRAE